MLFSHDLCWLTIDFRVAIGLVISQVPRYRSLLIGRVAPYSFVQFCGWNVIVRGLCGAGHCMLVKHSNCPLFLCGFF